MAASSRCIHMRVTPPTSAHARDPHTAASRTAQTAWGLATMDKGQWPHLQIGRELLCTVPLCGGTGQSVVRVAQRGPQVALPVLRLSNAVARAAHDSGHLRQSLR